MPDDKRVLEAAAKASQGLRLDAGDGLALAEGADLPLLGSLGHRARMAREKEGRHE